MRRAATALLVVGVCAACGSSRTAPRVLAVRNSYLGLNCPHAYPCAHLGIALWLSGPARRVTVELHGHRVSLVTRHRYEYRRYWQGFVRDTRAAQMAGDLDRRLRLTVAATGADGALQRTELTSPVSPGWG